MQKAIVVILTSVAALASARASHFKVLQQSLFYCDEQVPVRRAILYVDRSCLNFVYINFCFLFGIFLRLKIFFAMDFKPVSLIPHLQSRNLTDIFLTLMIYPVVSTSHMFHAMPE